MREKLKICFRWALIGVLSGLSFPVLSASSSPELEVVVFDVWNCFEQEEIADVRAQADVLYFLTSLQGIVNRDAPRLYLLAAQSLFDLESKYRGTPEVDTVPVTDLDGFWLDWLTKKGWVRSEPIVRLKTLDEVIARYRPEIKGLVQWDVSVGATLNAALMAAGAEDFLPVSDRLADGALRRRLRETFPDLQVKLDLSGVFNGAAVALDGIEFESCGSAKNDVYRFCLERFLKTGQLNPAWMWYNIDGYIWNSPDGWAKAAYSGKLYARLGNRARFQHNGFYNTDFWVGRKALFIDLYPWGDSVASDDPGQRVGEDLKMWNDLLELSYRQRNSRFGICGGFIPWWLKYTKAQGTPHNAVSGEHEFIKLLSSYNMLNDADAAFGLANASFFQHMPRIPRQDCHWDYPPPKKLKTGTTYLSFMMMDYDGSAWLDQAAVSIYDDPARGKIPLNWCINPVLNHRVPHAFRYMVETRTDQDFFGIESDGTGYISPYYLQAGNRAGRIQEDGLAPYEKFARKVRARYRFRYNSFFITPKVDTPWLEMCARLNPAGFGVHTPAPPVTAGGVPVIKFSYYASVPDVGNGTFCKKLEALYSGSVQGGPENHFEAWRCILLRPSHIVDAVAAMEAAYPDANVEIVDWPNFLRLKKAALEREQKR